ncbi:MAG: 4Fe-4S cluster-binding domain-containing protein [Clostridiales bacterium]|nr:4Fe-4S cluster-binding domain-containing protein [Clostridiales bacterium]
MKCLDCPRACKADRDIGEVGFCGGGKNAVVAKTVSQFTYEEPCLGTVMAVFFGGCALKCSYCQNYKISRSGVGKEYGDKELAELFDSSEYSIDLVTPSHFLSAIERALPQCENKHNYIYNTSGYETTEAVRRAAAFSDVFLTDFKYSDEQLSVKLSCARDYPKVAVAAMQEMRKTSDEWIEVNGARILKRGMIVRHLVLPGNVNNSLRALDMIAESVGTNTVLSLMSQFTPNGVGEPHEKLRKIEYKAVAEHALKLGFGSGYFQQFSSASSSYTPEF